MEREVDLFTSNPFAAAWGTEEKALKKLITSPTEVASLTQVEAKIATQKQEFARFLEVVGSLSNVTQSLLGLGHIAGACACHGGAMLATVTKGSVNLNMPFHLHADGSAHYESHTDESHILMKPAPKKVTWHQPQSTQPSSRTTTKPRPFIAEQTRGLGQLFEPTFASISFQQLLVG